MSGFTDAVSQDEEARKRDEERGKKPFDFSDRS